MICNEHLKEALCLAPCLAALFNECLRQGSIPTSWRDALLTVIPKGKGDPLDPSAWRGIARKSCCYKLLASILTDRLSLFLDFVHCIPEEQHGFRANRSTYSACSQLLDHIRNTLRRPRQFLYAVFIDFRAAFDTAPRHAALEKLGRAGVPPTFLELIRSILQEGSIIIDDGNAELEPFVQTTGVAQGDNLSPLLFNVVISDLPHFIKGRHPQIDLLLYADDLVIFSHSRFHLQQALATMCVYLDSLGLEINLAKTEAMKFRRGGRLAATDSIHLGGSEVRFVNHFTYLGVTIPSNGVSFGQHIDERSRKAMIASVGIEHPQKLSLNTALALFDLKISPTACYGIPLIWDSLTVNQLERLDRVKPSFLKRALGLHISSPNRKVYLLCSTPLFVEQLVQRFQLSKTVAYRKFIERYEEKMAELEPEFFTTRAMTNDTWKGVNRTNRHAVTRFAIHGYHHMLCQVQGHHAPDDRCVCMRCGEGCSLYHGMNCAGVVSLNVLANAP